MNSLKHTSFALSNRYVALSLAILILVAIGMSVQNMLLPNNFVYSGKNYTHYNNFVIFRYSFENLWTGKNMYIRYESYCDLFKYSPTFALVMAPFWLLPERAGLLVWNVSGVLLLAAGLRFFCSKPSHLFLLVLVLLAEMAASVSNSQSNTHIAGLLLLSAAAMERGKIGLSTFFVVCTVYIKLFTLVFAVFYLLYPKVWKSALWFVMWMVLFLFLPALVCGLPKLFEQYHNWWLMLRGDHEDSIGYSLAGFLIAAFNLNINKDVILIFGTMVLLLPLVRWKEYADSVFRISYFALILIWVVVFNHKAESPTFIIAMTGVVLLAHINNYSGALLVLMCASLVFTSLTTTDLCPRIWRSNFIEPYRIKALFPSLTFFYGVFMLLMRRPAHPGSGSQELPGVL